jgi:5-oxoprolinase (ATP-hydrolysing)
LFPFSENTAYIDERIEALVKHCREHLTGQKFSAISTEIFLHLRYEGTDCALMCQPEPGPTVLSKHGDFVSSFVKKYNTDNLTLDQGLVPMSNTCYAIFRHT